MLVVVFVFYCINVSGTQRFQCSEIAMVGPVQSKISAVLLAISDEFSDRTSHVL